VITGHPDDAARSRALDAGVLGYFAKPIGGDELLLCIRSAVAKRKANRRPK